MPPQQAGEKWNSGENILCALTLGKGSRTCLPFQMPSAMAGRDFADLRRLIKKEL